MLPRIYDDLEKFLKPGKVLVIYGPRRIGKTTILQNYLKQTSYKHRLDSGDNIRLQHVLSSQDFSQIIPYAEGYALLAIDEAQQVENIGMALKIIVDQLPKIRVIATGSSSFDLANRIGEPLTGRKVTLTLYPVSQLELLNYRTFNRFELKENLEQFLIYGSYPEVLTAKSNREKILLVEEIVGSYLLKDILTLEKVKGSRILLDLLKLLAFQLGSEVSLNELAGSLGIDAKTVARYLDLLEKSFVLFNLRGFSRNLRKEIYKKSKYYFYDNGIRNAIISNFNELSLRDDIGKLWENFLVLERLKKQAYKKISANNYFWRTWDQKEIDWVEEREGKLFGFEFKYSPSKIKIPQDFLKAYPNSSFTTISKGNYLEFIT